MNKITFPLSLGKQGPEVGDLQAALLGLLERAVILPNDEGMRRELSINVQHERTTQTYGGATAELVSIFQRQRHHGSRGNVDEAKAKEITAFVREFGVMDGQDDGRTEVVKALDGQGPVVAALQDTLQLFLDRASSWPTTKARADSCWRHCN